MFLSSFVQSPERGGPTRCRFKMSRSGRRGSFLSRWGGEAPDAPSSSRKSFFSALMSSKSDEASTSRFSRFSTFGNRKSVAASARSMLGFKRFTPMATVDGHNKYEADEEELCLVVLLSEIQRSKAFAKDILMKPRHSKTRERSACSHPVQLCRSPASHSHAADRVSSPFLVTVDRTDFRELVKQLLSASVNFMNPDEEQIDAIFDELDTEDVGTLALAEVRSKLLPPPTKKASLPGTKSGASTTKIDKKKSVDEMVVPKKSGTKKKVTVRVAPE